MKILGLIRWIGLVAGCQTARESSDTEIGAQAPCELSSNGLLAQASPVSHCAGMHACSGSTAAFTVDTSYCEFVDTALYDATGQLVGYIHGTDTTDVLQCPENGEIACESPESFVGIGCVTYGTGEVLDACQNAPNVSHGLIAPTLDDALERTATECLATASCKHNGDDSVVVATIEPTECVDDNSRRYDVFNALTGDLVSSALQPGQFDPIRLCGSTGIGWSREAIPECLYMDFTVSASCGFTLGMPPAMAALFSSSDPG